MDLFSPKVSDLHNFHIQSGVVKLSGPKNDSRGPKFRVQRMIYEVHMDDFGVRALIT